MDRNSVEWKGYLPAVTTPFTAEGELDRAGWQELLEWMVSEGMHGVAVAGTTGEWFSLSPEERKELFRLAAEQIRGRVPILDGCNAYTPREAIEYAEAAKDVGLEGILLTPPPYVVPNNREIVHFYRTISEAVAIPLLRLQLAPGDQRRYGYQDTGAIDRARYRSRDQELDGRYWTLSGRILRLEGSRPLLRHSHVGARHHTRRATWWRRDDRCGCRARLRASQFLQPCVAGDLEKARRSGVRDRKLFEDWINPDYSMKLGSPTAIFKTALNLRNLPGGYPRPPTLPLTDEEVEKVRQTLSELSLIAPIAT